MKIKLFDKLENIKENLKIIDYSPRIIFLRRVSSSNISSRSVLKLPPALDAVGAAPGGFGAPPPGGLGKPPPGGLGAGFFIKEGLATTPLGGASPPPVGGNLGGGGNDLPAGGPDFAGGPADGGPDFVGGPADGGPDFVGGPGFIGAPPLGGPGFIGAPPLGGPEALAVAGAGAPGDPLNRLNKVLAATCLAGPSTDSSEASLVEDVLTVLSLDTLTPLISFSAFFSDLENSLIEFTVSCKTSDKSPKLFLKYLITRVTVVLSSLGKSIHLF